RRPSRSRAGEGTRSSRWGPRSCAASPPGAWWENPAPRTRQSPSSAGCAAIPAPPREGPRGRTRTARASARPRPGTWAPAPPWSSRARRGLQPLVALLLELEGEVLAPRLHDAAVQEDVHNVGDDVVEEALVVRDQHHRPLRRAELVHAGSNDAQGVDVEAGVRLVQDGQGRIQDRHLEDLVALLLAAGEAFVHRPLDERLVDVHDLGLLLHQGEEVDGVQLRLSAMLADRVGGRLQEIDVADAGDLDRILEGQEHAFARPLFRAH